jgi:spectinomycin phosphotransferase
MTPMREPPPLAEASIVEALRTGFGVEVGVLEFLPVGNDAASWSYRVEAAGGGKLYLKLRAGGEAMPGAAVPSHLERHGVPNVLAPLRARDGSPAVRLGHLWLALYPMLDGRPAGQAGLSPAQWRQFGATVALVHALPPTPELGRLVPVEAFRPSRRELIGGLDELLTGPGPHDPATAKLAGFWRDRREQILELAGRADQAGRRLAARPLRTVLCHADLHTFNVLVEPGGTLWIVDWDEAVLAPMERDLMFVMRGISGRLITPADTEHFLEGYGDAAVDPDLLGYYRLAWAVQDIAANAEEVTALPWLGEESRAASVDGFLSLFEPGEIVEIATAGQPLRASRRRSRGDGSANG